MTVPPPPVALVQGRSHCALDKPVQYVRGVGPYRAKLLSGLGVETVGDLIEYFPFRHEFQGAPQAIDTLELDKPATVIGRVETLRVRGAARQEQINVMLRDGTGRLRITWFNASHLRGRLERGQVLRVFGTIGEYENLAQMVNPRVEWLNAEADFSQFDQERLVPVYRSTAALTSQQIARLISAVLPEALPAVDEILPDALIRRRRLAGRARAVAAMHHPQNLDQQAHARRRVAYEELFLMQLAITLQRRFVAVHTRALPLKSRPEIDERIRRRFPFDLTPAQNRVIGEIVADLAGERPMTRLLQGDVGSGKTVVALYAALVAVANRTQCAILAPTEVLAAQHAASIEKYLAGSRVNRCLLTGKTPAARRERMLREIAAGHMNLIVGTQALLETKVRFHTLGLVIVDEQHKFGVSQRAMLRDKRGEEVERGEGGAGETWGAGDGKLRGRMEAQTPGRVVRKSGIGTRRPEIPHYLVMTATPIPRTLSMTVFGDLDVSIIDELPPGRQPITTRLVRPREEAAAWLEVRKRLVAGQQVYIVYPLVEESEVLDVKAATAEVRRVSQELLPGSRVGLLHGRMRNTEKQQVMGKFAAGDLDVLVATTVIEVGVDVPNATVMAIQHAERYGLAALHQLRGRVGRGRTASVCLLMAVDPSELARQRLNVLCRTGDGFKIAEEDLRLRGPGELLGTRQHGWPEFRVANLVEDTDLLLQARDDAARLAREDPRLNAAGHATLRAELRRRFRDKIGFIDIA